MTVQLYLVILAELSTSMTFLLLLLITFSLAPSRRTCAQEVWRGGVHYTVRWLEVFPLEEELFPGTIVIVIVPTAVGRHAAR